MSWKTSVVAVLALSLLVGGCTRAHTVTKVKDASKVSLAFRRIGSASVEPITAGSSDVNLRMSAIDVDEDGYLQRENGVVRIACAKCTGTTFTLLDGERLTATVDESVTTILGEGSGARRVQLPFQYSVSGALDIYPELRTSTSNVEYFEQTTEPVSELAWLLVPGGVLAIVGLIVIPQDAVIGMSMFTPGLALSAFGGLHLVLPEETQRFNALGRPIATRPEAPPRAPRSLAPEAEEGTEGADDAEPNGDATSDADEGERPTDE